MKKTITTISKTFITPNATEPLRWIAHNDTCYQHRYFTIYALPQGLMNIGRYCSVIRDNDDRAGFSIYDSFGFSGKGKSINTAVASFVAAATVTPSYECDFDTVATGDEREGVVWWTSNQRMNKVAHEVPIVLMPQRNIVRPLQLTGVINSDESIDISLSINDVRMVDGKETAVHLFSVQFVDFRYISNPYPNNNVFNLAVDTAVDKLADAQFYDIIYHTITNTTKSFNDIDLTNRVVANFTNTVRPPVIDNGKHGKNGLVSMSVVEIP